MREDACIAHSRCGRINDLYKRRTILVVRVAKDRFGLKRIFGFMGNVITGIKSNLKEKPQITDIAERSVTRRI